MALKLILDSLTGVDSSLHGLYEQKDGKYHLKLDGDVVPKSKLAEFRDNNISLNDEMKTLKEQLANFSDIDPAKAKEAMQKLQDMQDKKLIDSGQIDELLKARTERMQADFDGKIAAFEAER